MATFTPGHVSCSVEKSKDRTTEMEKREKDVEVGGKNIDVRT